MPKAPKEIPTFALEPFTPDGSHPDELFAIEGALMVLQGLRVGRIVGDKIEWLEKTVPDLGPAVGGSRIYFIGGKWPDAVDALYTSNNGRAPMPSYHPLTGKGINFTYQPGGGAGHTSYLPKIRYLVAATAL